MAALKLLFAALALSWPIAASADPVDRWADEIARASARFVVPEQWIRRVMRAESNGHAQLGGVPIVSRAGAIGLMQLMPDTWSDMRAALGLGSDAHDPADNIAAGTAYLRLMYERFGYPGLFAAYNAGPARYSAWLSGQRRLPAETRSYVAAVATQEASARGAPRRPTGTMGAETSSSQAARVKAQSLQPTSRGLFVPLEGTSKL